MKTVKIDFDFSQLLTIVKQCDLNQKLAIIKAIEKDTFKKRLSILLSELKNNSINPEDIIKETEKVRKARYIKKSKK
ncbi:MAG: hypothetical protein HYU67_04600 [Flavobacteriia bacterium]|nr:hypothetical protein [Flavobacteriia bacterium]